MMFAGSRRLAPARAGGRASFVQGAEQNLGATGG